MAHGLDDAVATVSAAAPPEKPVGLERLIAPVNHVVVLFSSISLVVASIVLTYSVVSRYFLHFSTDWQDEFSIFCIVGAVFMSSAAVQARRGHVGIEAIAAILSDRANAVRLFLVDVASLVFCGYFSWKSWILLHEAIVEGFRTGSTWQPPLWVPYSLMTVGMVLLTAQILLQVADQIRRWTRPA